MDQVHNDVFKVKGSIMQLGEDDPKMQAWAGQLSAWLREVTLVLPEALFDKKAVPATQMPRVKLLRGNLDF